MYFPIFLQLLLHAYISITPHIAFLCLYHYIKRITKSQDNHDEEETGKIVADPETDVSLHTTDIQMNGGS